MTGRSKTVTVESPDAVVEELHQIYTWDHGPDIRRALLQHPETRELLMHTPGVVSRIFGSQTKMSLRLVPEYDGQGPPNLVAYIHTDQPPEMALKHLKQFDEEWWIDLEPRFGDVLAFSLRFE